MKIESVVKINLDGEYEVLYMGASRGIARQVYKENMSKKEGYLALFQQSGYSSRSMSKGGHKAHKEKSEIKEIKAEEKPKRRRKKVSED